MRGHARERDLGRGGVEGLGDDLPQLGGVDRVGEIAGEAGEVEGLRPAQPDLLVGHEGDADVAVAVLRAEIGQERHDDGDRGLVVGAEHAGPVAEDDVGADPGLELGMLGRAQPDVLLRVEAEIRPRVAPQLRAHHRRQAHVDGVEMGDEADPGRARHGPGLPRGDGGVAVDHDVGEAEIAQFRRQHLGETLLSRRARQRRRAGVALALDRDVAQEAPDQLRAPVHRVGCSALSAAAAAPIARPVRPHRGHGRGTVPYARARARVNATGTARRALAVLLGLERRRSHPLIRCPIDRSAIPAGSLREAETSARAPRGLV